MINAVLYVFDGQEIEAKRVASERERLGIELYNLQQRLGGMQQSWERVQTEHTKVVNIRAESESIVPEMKKAYQEQLGDFKELQRKGTH